MSKFMNNSNRRSNFNQVVFNGNLPKTPNMTSYSTKNGSHVSKAYFDVLSDSFYNGYQTTTDFQCVAFGKHAENIATKFNKGDFVEAKGTTQTYRTNKIQGVTLKYKVTVTHFNIYSLKKITKGSKLTSNKTSVPNIGKVTKRVNNASQKKTPIKASNGSMKTVNVSDNDLPF